MTEAYRGGIHIAADPDRVFDYFTDATRLARWMGDRAVVDPRPGGEFTLHIDGGPIAGRYLEVDRPRRVVISWGRAGSAGFPPGISTLEVLLSPERGGTRVEITHTGLPPSEARQHEEGWRHYLPRLAAAAAGADPGADPWAGAPSRYAVPGSDR